jgi:hypothetical protein
VQHGQVGKASVVVLGVVLVLAGAAGALALRLNAPATPAVLAVSVLYFQVTGDAPPRWAAAAFAESLATRLSSVQGVRASPGISGLASADYVVDGDVVMRDQRTALAVRLRRAGQAQPTWTATFWRQDAMDPELHGEIALAVAEALGSAQRPPVTPGAGSR